MKADTNRLVFFELLRAGLWEKEACISQYKIIEYPAVMKLAEEQSVVGLITAGLEQVKDVKIPQAWTFQFIGISLQIEQRNKYMNQFINILVDKLRAARINVILFKGQGIAQCYERPLWRSAGDIDFLLDKDNYESAKALIQPLSQRIEEEFENRKHILFYINDWPVELHGTLRGDVIPRIDVELDSIQNRMFKEGKVLEWKNEKNIILTPSANENVIIIFTHILQHFFEGGIGLRQICDWARLLWVNKEKLDYTFIEKTIRTMKIMTEWKSFASFAVLYLAYPTEYMPFYVCSNRYKKNAERIVDFVLETGNFGHNRDRLYLKQSSYLIRKAISFKRQTQNGLRRFLIFPLDSFYTWMHVVKKGFEDISNKK